MTIPEWVKPAAWGVIGGAIAAMIIGFVWGGWVTGGTAGKMETASAEAAVVAGIYATLRCQGGAAAGTARAPEGGEQL